MDRAREFWADLRANWDDHYWWARHQWLMAILLGVISLTFTYLEARIARVAEAS